MNTHAAAITARIAQTEALQQLAEQRAAQPGADLPALRITWKQHAHTLAVLRNTDLTPPADVQDTIYRNPEDPWTRQQPDEWLGDWD
ncbi:hypothetical protein ICV35_24905 [Rhodococcus ruber]|uniref:hypothetical protein n=1 Tax=Rhodococcus ruber TaxID=1830 RepID=UPI00178094C6|nr:hypothetical protein [Rhodococcus ruber]MBD8056890.1 hypothetical protein [Rhodococcus ruber]